VGAIEEVELVSQDDPVWSTTGLLPVDVARLDKLTEDEVSQRQFELENKMLIGGACSEEESKECDSFKVIIV